MPSGNEKEVMTFIADEGGQSTLRQVANGLGLAGHYTAVILECLGRADYLDMTRRGEVTLLPKGYRAIKRDVETLPTETEKGVTNA